MIRILRFNEGKSNEDIKSIWRIDPFEIKEIMDAELDNFELTEIQLSLMSMGKFLSMTSCYYLFGNKLEQVRHSQLGNLKQARPGMINKIFNRSSLEYPKPTLYYVDGDYNCTPVIILKFDGSAQKINIENALLRLNKAYPEYSDFDLKIDIDRRHSTPFIKVHEWATTLYYIGDL